MVCMINNNQPQINIVQFEQFCVYDELLLCNHIMKIKQMIMLDIFHFHFLFYGKFIDFSILNGTKK